MTSTQSQHCFLPALAVGKTTKVMVLYEKIQNDPLEFPPEVNMSAGLKRLLRAMMEKGAAQRITLDQVRAMMEPTFEQFFSGSL